MLDNQRPEDRAWETTEAEWQAIRSASLKHAARLIRRGERRFFLFSDEPVAAADYEAQLRAAGGEVLALPGGGGGADMGGGRADGQPAEAIPADARPAVDLFRMAACRRILQVSKMSSFSTTAAAMGGGELVNFQRRNKRLFSWKGVVDAHLAR